MLKLTSKIIEEIQNRREMYLKSAEHAFKLSNIAGKKSNSSTELVMMVKSAIS